MPREGEPRPTVWKARDTLFLTFLDQSYGGILSDRQMERLRRQKIEGVKLPALTKGTLAAKILFHRITPAKQQARHDQLLGGLSADERQVVETSLGLNVCGPALDKSDTAVQLQIEPETLDSLILSATGKLTPQSPKQ